MRQQWTVGATNLKDRQEDFEGHSVIGSVLLDQLLDLRLRRVLAESSDDVTDHRDRDLSIAAVVVQQERLVEVADLKQKFDGIW